MTRVNALRVKKSTLKKKETKNLPPSFETKLLQPSLFVRPRSSSAPPRQKPRL